MNLQIDVSPEERKLAKWPHEVFLINLIFNHIFMFCAVMAVYTTFPLAPLMVPAISFGIIGYLFIKGNQIANNNPSWYVKSHWQIAGKRNRLFTLLLTVTCIICGGGLLLSQAMGWSKIPTIALIGGAGLLPFMVSLLVLIVLGNESVFMARDGKLPKSFADQLPAEYQTEAQAQS